jgi:transposase
LAPRRSPALPDLATAHEQGLNDFDADVWTAFFLPKGTPSTIVQRLAHATSDALDAPAVHQRFADLGLRVARPDYAAHKHPKVLEWLAHHPRFVFHFIPTSASWLNAVEGLFATLTKRRLKRGVFRSIQELKHAIHSFIADTNAKPKPFIWTKDPDKIIAAAKRGHQVLDSIH